MTSVPSGNDKQCSVLIVNCTGRETAHSQALQQRGFRVVELSEWPSDGVVLQYEIVIIVLRRMDSISMTAARMRAKPKFGMRVLIGVTESAPSGAERRHAVVSGFDDMVGESRDSRILIARILRTLRERPEHRCLVPERKRPAA
jgi:response regulator RpfG family c-di-GMP phosphodiesterase